MMERSRKQWTAREIEKLRRMAGNLSHFEISRRLIRPIKGILRKAERLGIDMPDVREKPKEICPSCGGWGVIRLEADSGTLTRTIYCFRCNPLAKTG